MDRMAIVKDNEEKLIMSWPRPFTVIIDMAIVVWILDLLLKPGRNERNCPA